MENSLRMLRKYYSIVRLLFVLYLIIFLYACSPSAFLQDLFYSEPTVSITVIRVHAEPTGQSLNIYIDKKLKMKVPNGSYVDTVLHAGIYVLSFDWPPIGDFLPEKDIQITVEENQRYYFLINHFNKSVRLSTYDPDSILNVVSSNDSESNILNVKQIPKNEASLIMEALDQANLEIKKSFTN